MGKWSIYLLSSEINTHIHVIDSKNFQYFTIIELQTILVTLDVMPQVGVEFCGLTVD